jgi:hypothetical protein
VLESLEIPSENISFDEKAVETWLHHDDAEAMSVHPRDSPMERERLKRNCPRDPNSRRKLGGVFL